MIMKYLLLALCLAFLGRCDAYPKPNYHSNVPKKDAPVIAKTFEEILVINEERNDLFEGDIVLSSQRNAIADKSARWGTTIPYVLSDEYSHERKSIIISALYELEVRACFTFTERTTEADYLLFEIQSGCYSNVGRVGGKQIVSIGVGCENHRTVIHETLHALGFWHEQSRTDRDAYVTIVWDVISDGKESNFNKYESDILDTQGVPYDYDSIMHYHDSAFSKNGSKTIIAPAEKTATMGKMDAMSKVDVEELNQLYECEENIDTGGYTQWSRWGLCDQNCNKVRQRFCDGDQCSTWGTVETETGTCDESLCEVGYDPDCGPKTLEGSTGSIASPLYPYSYKSNAECTRKIITPEGSRVRLEFQDLDIEDYEGECQFDFLYVYDGPDETSPSLGIYCGQILPTTIFATSNVLTMKFTSDYSVVKNGFVANYNAMYGSLHTCSFEQTNDLCKWTVDSSVELAFLPNKGTTASVGTGPPTDHTFSNSQGQYLYLESSAPAASGERARIISPLFYPMGNGEFCISVWYNMYGVNTGSLSVYMVSDNGTMSSSPLTTISGDKGDDSWYQLSISITSSIPYKFAIEAVRGNGYKGDIAIDDVALDVGKCP